MNQGDVFLPQRALETRWQLSGRTLERWRAEGYGPPWCILGGSVRYRLSDIEAFEAQHRHLGSLASPVKGGAQ